ncbi:response regulator [Lysobacter sp. A6]|uniref:histidine kinase n=1 Tax=Noviluteimonas lactosilytica TaxID=2888523 RepID=A0ABS8JGI6_9GAMM|nr:response regulator [Lysobacter lactosilyticus]MCC8362720.1 response regulator [Lysobacter lactosilyticus]
MDNEPSVRKGTTTLIVDDNAATRYAMRRVIERQGWRVLEAQAGAEGLSILEREPIDVLVLDVNLPDMNGFDIVRILRGAERTRLLPIVHVSAASIHTRDVITGLEGGADSYLVHPVDPGLLLATMRTLMRVREAEDAMRESEQRLREIFSNVAAPIAVIDSALVIHERNAAFEPLIGEHASLASRVEPGQEVQLAGLQERIGRGERWIGALSMRVNQELREYEWRVVPWREELGLMLVEDVTHHRRRERQQAERLDSARSRLAEAISERDATQMQLVQSQKMDALGQLTGGIAHDFNNLLTGIITSLGLLSDEAAAGRTAAVQQYADTAMTSARRAASLTHRLLAFARQQPLDTRTVDINARIASLEDLLHRTIGEQVQLQLDLQPDAAIARVDANQLENAVLNLVVNARDAMSDGGRIRVGTRRPERHALRDLAPGDYVELFVEDDGSGIPEDVLEKVFEPFFTTKPIGQGTGLGLSMTYGFARQSGGDARIVSTPGMGTTVTLLLPLGDAAHIALDPHTSQSGPPVAGNGETILIVEDADSVRELTATLLGIAGYRCLQAPDVERALEILHGPEPIDLLLTDVGLPRMNGRQLADAARATRPKLPVLFLTGYARHSVAVGDFLGEGMDMMTKPYDAEALLARIGHMVGAARNAPA